MKTVKKYISILLICLIVLSNVLFRVTPVNAEVKDVVLSGYSYNISNSPTLTDGDTFNITLHVKKNTSNAVVDYIEITGSSFSLKDGGSTLTARPEGSNFKTDDTTFVFNGGSKRLEVNIYYKINGVDYNLSDFINISQAIPDTSSSAPEDTTKKAPKIVISGNSPIPSGQAGYQITYALPIKNAGQYVAKKVTVSPVLDGSVPIEIESMNLSQTIDSMLPNEATEVKFTFSITPGAAAKTYPIKFNIQFYNTYNDYYSTTETGYIKTLEGNALPKLILKTVTTNPSPVQPGQDFQMDITLENEGQLSAKNVSVTLLGLKNDGVSIQGTTSKQTRSIIYGYDTSTITYNLSASKKIEAGANSLKLKLDYSDPDGESHSEEIDFFINIQGQDSQTIVELKNIVSPASALSPGENALVAFDVVNTGTEDARNVKVTVTADKEIIPRTQNTIIIPTLKKGETKNVQFQLFISDEAVTKNYAVALNVEYDVPSADAASKQTVMQYVGFYVENSTGKTVPRLIIDSYSINPKTIKAGQPFTLDLSILNTSKSSSIKNVKITLNSDDGTFSTVNSNSFYIDNISPKKNVKKQISFSSKSDAAPKQYTISVNYDYEDDKGNPYTTKDIVGIPLTQATRLVIGDFSFPPEAFIGNPVPINVSFYNMGKSTLYNLLVKLEGDFKVEGTSYFVGNFEPGKTDSFDGAITPGAAGPVKGFVIFSYEDAEGNPQEVKKEITLNASEMPAPPPMPGDGSMPQEGGKKFPLWAYIASGTGLLAVMVTVILLVRRKIRRRKELLFDEEL